VSEPGLSGVIEQIVIQSVNNVVRVRYIQKPRSRISANFGLFFRMAQANLRIFVSEREVSRFVTTNCRIHGDKIYTKSCIPVRAPPLDSLRPD
jgi:hypothetical protein